MAQMELALKQTAAALINIWETNKEVKHQDQVRIFLEFALKDYRSLGKECIAEVTSAYIQPLFAVPPYLNPDARNVLERLKSQEKLVALICNTGTTPGTALRRLLQREGVAQHFDCMLFSEEIGIRKPDIRIFRLAAEKLGISPNEGVHVGDNLKCDVWGAQQAGFRAIHLSSEEGRDRLAESDPSSMVSWSRRLGDQEKSRIKPDKVIPSLGMAMNAIMELETGY